jgi:hypothetical protein
MLVDAWILQPGAEHARILGELIGTNDVRGNLVPDAALAALAIEHGLTLCSTDTDVARFTALRWANHCDKQPGPASSCPGVAVTQDRAARRFCRHQIRR